jgi:amidase
VSVESGTVVAFETQDDNYFRLSQGEQLGKGGFTLETFNVVTGPCEVKGAMPGDALRIDILDITISRCWSVWEADEECNGCLSAKLALCNKKASVRKLPIAEVAQKVYVSERMALPMDPMIGCIATASESKYLASTFVPTYPNGGNMDLREASKGATIWLPVLVPGGLLYVGDLHACMGRGEPALVGFEAAGVATLRITLEKQAAPKWPKLRVGTATIFSAALSNHNASFQLALEQAYDWLTSPEGGDLTPEEAFGFCTAQVEARFGGPASRQVLMVVPDAKPFLQHPLPGADSTS